MSDTNDTEQANLDPHRTLNRYDDREEEWRSAEVYEHPRRTLRNGWQKFHATRDCGSSNVYYIEDNRSRHHGSDKYEYDLRCGKCGHRVPEDAVLFIGGEWYSQYGWQAYGRPLEELNLPSDRVLSLGPDPSHDQLVDALNLTRIEREASCHGVSFGNEHYYECDGCGKETMLLFDDHCRMCYGGEWTDRMTNSLLALGRSIRERNQSFVHRIDQQVDPLNPTGTATPDQILWRKRAGRASKIVVVIQRLKDDETGHYEYILSDPQTGSEWRYHEDEVDAQFYDTQLTVGDWYSSIDDEQLQKLCEQAGRYDE